MSSRSPQSRRTYAGSRSWSLDHHQRPMHVLRSRCHGSVPFDPASPLGKERMVRAVPRDRAGSLAATIADFCNKIGTKRTFGAKFATSAFGRGFNRSTQHLLILLDWEVSDGGECTDVVHAETAAATPAEKGADLCCDGFCSGRSPPSSEPGTMTPAIFTR